MTALTQDTSLHPAANHSTCYETDPSRSSHQSCLSYLSKIIFLVLNMKLPQKLFNKLNGLHYPQEYLCLAKETFENSLRVYLVANGNIIKDITNEHVFTGYNPLIFTLHVPLSKVFPQP